MRNAHDLTALDRGKGFAQRGDERLQIFQLGAARRKYYYRDSEFVQVVLIRQVAVSGDKDVELGLGPPVQLSIFYACSTRVGYSAHVETH